MIAVAILTYNRPREIRETINALIKHLRYDGDLQWFIGDDGSPGDYIPELVKDYRELHFTITKTERKGWGANANLLLKSAFGCTDYVFFTEDDYVALGAIDLNQGMTVLQHDPTVGMIRYDGVAGHTLTLELKEAGCVNYATIRKDSPHLNVYSNRPHLFSKKFVREYGPYVEGKPLGNTEENYAHRVKEGTGKNVAILSNGIESRFAHIGATHQGTEADPCHNK